MSYCGWRVLLYSQLHNQMSNTSSSFVVLVVEVSADLALDIRSLWLDALSLQWTLLSSSKQMWQLQATHIYHRQWAQILNNSYRSLHIGCCSPPESNFTCVGIHTSTESSWSRLLAVIEFVLSHRYWPAAKCFCRLTIFAELLVSSISWRSG